MKNVADTANFVDDTQKLVADSFNLAELFKLFADPIYLRLRGLGLNLSIWAV